MPVNEQWYNAACEYGAFPRTQWTRRFFDEWAQWEGVPEWICNPLATTEPAPGLRSSVDLGFGPGRWNTANEPYGVGIFKDQTAGGQATAKTLLNGFYPALVRAIVQQDIVDHNAVAANIRTWGTMGFAQKVQDGWEPVGNTTPSPPSVVDEPVIGGNISEQRVREIIDQTFPALFRRMMAAYWTDIVGDYTTLDGDPIPPDGAVVKAISEDVLEYWWGKIG